MEEAFKNDIKELRNQVDTLSQKMDQVKTEVEKAKKNASRAETAARDTNGNIWFVGLIIIALLGFITNPSFKQHYDFLEKEGHSLSIDRARSGYTSYYVFSIIDNLDGDYEEKMITFGIFGNVFKINNP